MPRVKVKSVENVEPVGCQTCIDHPGLDRAPSPEAEVCPDCNGSPFGLPGAEVTVDVAPSDEEVVEA